MFETVLEIEDSSAEVILKEEDVDTDGMNYLAGKTGILPSISYFGQNQTRNRKIVTLPSAIYSLLSSASLSASL